MTVMLFFNSLKDILSVNKKFENAELESQYDRLVMKGVYVLCCSGNLLIGLWKLNAMGLIPNKSGDWLSWETTLAAVQDVVL
ncbi:DEKNAAC105535 [Brettanomyces naardenensis]|uniref:ER membrane protein complex subunit 4 n=1 Tax=Brettanomyces naardenensis TaxID=13370 RepID=A0A448YTT4_BRENA|nr:DEKNAAC105535 [Brettanomyces naardenensis]